VHFTRRHFADDRIRTEKTSLSANFSVKSEGLILIPRLFSSKPLSTRFVVLSVFLCEGEFEMCEGGIQILFKGFDQGGESIPAGPHKLLGQLPSLLVAGGVPDRDELSFDLRPGFIGYLGLEVLHPVEPTAVTEARGEDSLHRLDQSWSPVRGHHHRDAKTSCEHISKEVEPVLYERANQCCRWPGLDATLWAPTFRL
jgi:hypothetical protein